MARQQQQVRVPQSEHFLLEVAVEELMVLGLLEEHHLVALAVLEILVQVMLAEAVAVLAELAVILQGGMVAMEAPAYWGTAEEVQVEV